MNLFLISAIKFQLIYAIKASIGLIIDAKLAKNCCDLGNKHINWFNHLGWFDFHVGE